MYYDNDDSQTYYPEKKDKIDYKKFLWETIIDSYWNRYYWIYNNITDNDKSKWISFKDLIINKKIETQSYYNEVPQQVLKNNYWYIKSDEYNIICELKSNLEKKKVFIINLYFLIAFLLFIILACTLPATENLIPLDSYYTW